MCAAGGFNLTKFISPSSNLINKLPLEKRAQHPGNINIAGKETIERALGVTWCVEKDKLRFRIILQDKPMTRKGMLSSISSTYDPDGIAGPFLLGGRKILQEVTALKGGWDERPPEEFVSRWEKWRREILLLEHVEFPRCVKPPNFGMVSETSLHTFSDASEQGYGNCSYLRQVNQQGTIHVALVLAKSRVAPLKHITIPRLELAAATLACEVHSILHDELMMDDLGGAFWIDSKIVLGYILNEERRYRTYVANRVQKILSNTEKSQFNYVDTKTNPADYCSRGLSPKETEKMKKWFQGPSFLWQREDEWKKEEAITEYLPEDEELKKTVKVNRTVVELPSIIEILELRVSRWLRMKRIIAWVLRFIGNCRKEVSSRITGSPDIQALSEAETRTFQLLQALYFKSDLVAIKGETQLSKQSHLRKLNPFLDHRNVLRVGGRLRKGDIDAELKFPVIIPKESVIARRIVEWCHGKVEHAGRTTSLNEIRSRGYWVVNGSSIVRSVVYKCVLCRTFRGRFGQQKMADLPKSRIEPEAPFTYCGVDMIGTFFVKEGRKEVKRYATLFTCFSSRAIHIEVAHSLTTDSFIMSLRRFIARKG